MKILNYWVWVTGFGGAGRGAIQHYLFDVMQSICFDTSEGNDENPKALRSKTAKWSPQVIYGYIVAYS